MLDEEISARIRQLVQDKKTNPAAYAAVLGLDASALAKQLRGDRGVSLTTVRAILRHDPDINPDWLLHGTPPRLRTSAATPAHATATPAHHTATPAHTVNEGTGFVNRPGGAADKPGAAAIAGGGAAGWPGAAAIAGGGTTGKPVRECAHGLPLLPIGAIAGYESTGFDTGVMERDCPRYDVPGVRERGATVLITVDGDSMMPTLASGDVMALRPVTDRQSFRWSRLYVLDTDSGCFVKRLLPSSRPDAVTLRSDNPVYPDFDLPHDSIRGLYDVVATVRLL